jgi:hypothetical protein
VKEQERNKICKNDDTGMAKTQKIFWGFWVCVCVEWVFGQISRFKKKNTKNPSEFLICCNMLLIDNQKKLRSWKFEIYKIVVKLQIPIFLFFFEQQIH